MSDVGEVDHDRALRARVMLLGSDEPTVERAVWAYRALAAVSPRVYRAKLARALVEFGDHVPDHLLEYKLAIRTEAVTAARGADLTVAGRSDLLRDALLRLGAMWERAGRPDEARAVREEAATLDRGRH